MSFDNTIVPGGSAAQADMFQGRKGYGFWKGEKIRERIYVQFDEGRQKFQGQKIN